ncbi:MAG: metal ABC transporter solute-binding protein, Zn/Mn family [Clostridia bacterium]
MRCGVSGARLRLGLLASTASLLLVLAAGCGAGSGAPAGGTILAVGAENEYANVIQQVGGRYVSVVSFMSNPSTDPHVYEASTRDAIDVAKASLIVQNGLGYDSFMNRLEAASPNNQRIVLTVANAFGLSASTENPHLWYKPGTMARLSVIIARDLGRLDPSHRTYFARRAAAFRASLSRWTQAIKVLKQKFGGKSVAVTEPVCDYLLQASGLHISTPWAFQAAVMNGTDPSPEDVQAEDNLIIHHQVGFLAYNQQAVDAATLRLLSLARQYHVPVVGVYETMPPRYDYQQWMVAETRAFTRALSRHTSTVGLP